MPEFYKFDEGETRFRELIDLLKDEATGIDPGRWEDVVSTGYVKDLIERSLGASMDNFQRVWGMLPTLAEECKWRATVCRQYDASLEAYKVKLDVYNKMPHSPGELPPTVPPLPHPWVTPTVEV